jgi:tRNA A37 threonylcarbamoyladenosine dehydratase
MNERLSRLEPLFKEAGIKAIEAARIVIVGLGGVGGPCAETLVRSGVKHLLIIDHDLVQPSNLNRQILYTTDDIGKKKVACAYARFTAINPDIFMETSTDFIDSISMQIFNQFKPDFIIDAIDYIPGKKALIAYGLTNGIPTITSLGMGNRINPTKVKIGMLSETKGDPLAKMLRHDLRQLGININRVLVVYSEEMPRVKARPVASYMAVTSTAGLLLANYIIDKIITR